MKHIGTIGLSGRYLEDMFKQDLLKKIMALPHNHIRATFDRLTGYISPDDVLMVNFKNYMERNWISSAVQYTAEDTVQCASTNLCISF